ncbi:MAG: hypothetical protein REI11_20030 [Patulibacter sp.]|nr:hypothetical protein [Patulibacter sp.]
MNSRGRLGFTYTVEVESPDGTISQRETVHNLLPDEGIAHMLAVTFKGAAQVPTWYIALYKGNYSPTAAITAATFPALATEFTDYTPSARVEFNEGAVSGGALNNGANRAEFTATADATVYGGVITSSSPKGSVTGVIASAVRFSSPKVLATGDVLRVTAGVSLVSA